MKLYQYWDTGGPPTEVAAGIDSFKARNPGLIHRLYDRASAARFIRDRIGEREWRAFRACAVPAMQADYFRLCALWAAGGVYADADQTCGESLDTLLASLRGPLLPTREGLVTQHFMIFPAAGDAFLRSCIELATLNIETRDIPSVNTATGPGMMRALWVLLDPPSAPAIQERMTRARTLPWRFDKVVERARTSSAPGPEVAQAFAAIATIDRIAAFRWFSPVPSPYKASPAHWLNWPGSIYADGTVEAAS